jgi:hypothetical protein
MSVENPYGRTVQELRNAFESGDLLSAAGLLADEVSWHGEGVGRACHTRDDVLATLREGLDSGARYNLIDLRLVGDRVLLHLESAVTDAGHGPPPATIWQALTLDAAGLIVQLQGYSDAAAAEHDLALRSGSAEASVPAAGRVTRLVPFVFVAEMDRSVAFYRLLGFEVTATFEPNGVLSWASLDGGGAELMLALAASVIDPASQSILFYLYAPDLVGLRDHLVSQGLTPGEIVDGSPGPAQEMRLDDPDGYCLMIAQIDS